MADSISNTETKGALDVLAAEALTSKPASTSTKPIVSNKDVLSDMQKLYDQKLAEKNYFLQDMADAAAWWSGGAAGPSVGLALRAQTRAAQAKQLEDLQSQIMAGKVNIAQLGEAGEAMSAPSANVAGLTGGAPAGGQSVSPAVPGAGYTIRGIPVPEGIYKTYQAYLKQGNLAKANETFDNYNKEATKGEISFSTSPGTYKQDEFYDEKTGEITGKSPLQIRGAATSANVTRPTTNLTTPVQGFPANDAKVQKTEGGYKPVDGTSGAPVNFGINKRANPEVDVKNLTSEKASQIYEEKYWNAIGGDSLPPATARVAYDAAVNQGQNYAKKLIKETGGDPEKMLDKREQDYIKLAASDPRQKANLQGWLNRIDEIRKELKPEATQQTSAPTTTTGGKVPSYSEAKAIAAGSKNFQEQSQTAAGKASGTRQGAFESAAVDAGKDLQNANVMLNIMDQYPEAVGFGYKNKALGTTIEAVKLLTGKDIEPVARRAALSPEAIEAGNKFDKFAQENNLKFRQSVMKGTGQVSDFETKLTERASGLSKDNSVEANRFFATVAAENYRTLDKLGRDWQAYQQKNPGAKFAQFEQSDVWKNAQVEREARLKKYFPEIERGDIGFGQRAPTKGSDDSEMEGWRKRYGTQKGTR